MATILVTGIAGFIGSWTAKALSERGDTVIGIDNFNNYYDVKIKRDRIQNLAGKCQVFEVDMTDRDALKKVLGKFKIDKICHLAAQAGVPYSLKNPFAFENANNLGTLNVFETARELGIKSIIFASSSSVYGGNKKIPFSETDNIDKTISLYAATKRYNELIAHTYHHLFEMNLTALRFFTVYGPWGRPDMALFKFTKAINEGKPIDVYNFGKMKRDFTFIADIVAGVLAALDNNYPFEIFNLGNSTSVELNYFVSVIEKELGKKAEINLLPLQPGDVPETFADIDKAHRMLGFAPKTKIEDGIHQFVAWYKSYFSIKSTVDVR